MPHMILWVHVFLIWAAPATLLEAGITFWFWVLVLLQDVGTICNELPALVALNLSYNKMSHHVVGLQLKSIKILVLNYTGLNWSQVSRHTYLYFSLIYKLLG